MNLVTAAGIGFSMAGALAVAASQRAIWRTASGLVPVYPRVLARLRAHRQDRRFGLALMTAGALLEALAAYGYSAPPSLWRYPASAAAALIGVYALRRFMTVHGKAAPAASSAGSIYETPRTRTLREAALLEGASLRARELAREPRDTGIVFLAREWDRRWWSDRFGVSTNALQAAIRHVGPMVTDLERYLAINGQRGDALPA